MGISTGADDSYEPPLLARLLHRLPHLNVSLHHVNDTFDPKSPVYLESLGILASVPAAWLILTLFVLLVYLLTRCCDRKARAARSIAALKVTLAIVAVLCCAAVGLGLYGNDDLHNGITQMLEEGRQVDLMIEKIRNQTINMEQQLRKQVGSQLTELRDIFDEPVSNSTALRLCMDELQMIFNNNTLAADAAADIRQPLNDINFLPKVVVGEWVESVRWPVTMSVLSVLLVLCVVLLVGVARHSRCALIAFSVCGLLAVIACYIMASLYIAATVALADLCMEPDDYLEDQSSNELTREISRYYTNCERARANPFTLRQREGKTSIEHMRILLQDLRLPSIDLFPRRALDPRFTTLLNQVKEGDVLLASLTALVDCRALHSHYLRGTRCLCNVGLLGLVLMLASSVLAGLLLTVLVWVDSHTWIYIRKRKDYQQVTETDPYLPQPAASQAIAARTLQRSQGSSYPPDTPPPSYTSAMLHRPPPSAPLLPLPLPPPLHDNNTALMDGCDMRPSEQHHRMTAASGASGLPPGGGAGVAGGAGNAAHMSHLRGHTLGRLPSHHAHHHHHHGEGSGPNNGKYATLSKQCKTLESSDFY